MNKTRLWILFSLFVILSIFCLHGILSGAASDAYDASYYEETVIYEDGKLSVNYTDIPIIDVISDIEAETGIYFNISGDIPDGDISINIKKVPLRKGIENVIAKLLVKSYKFNHDTYSDSGSEIESIDIVFKEGPEESGGLVTSRSLDRPAEETKPDDKTTEDTEEDTTEKTDETLVGSKEIEDASQKYTPATTTTTGASSTTQGVYGAESKSSTPTSTRRSDVYGDENRNTNNYTPPTRQGNYGDEERNTTPAPNPNSYIYGDENR